MSGPASKEDSELLAAARIARERAHAPYSRFQVGAAVRTEHGVYSGCNIENAAYGSTMCAERVALFAARASGGGRVLSIAIVARPGVPCWPCGACRQVMVELAPDARVVVEGADATAAIRTVSELVPEAFDETDLGPRAGPAQPTAKSDSRAGLGSSPASGRT